MSAAVCEVCAEKSAGDGTSVASTVFEWLVVERFARQPDREKVRQTPGIEMVRNALATRRAGTAEWGISAKRYLKTPNVFGFHGVDKRLARHVGLVDDDMRLNANGYQLLRKWEREGARTGWLL